MFIIFDALIAEDRVWYLLKNICFSYNIGISVNSNYFLFQLLENRTKQSKHELELLESLEELKDLNKRQQNIDYDNLLSQFNTKEAQERILKLQEDEDEKYIKLVW